MLRGQRPATPQGLLMAPEENYDAETGLLSPRGLESAIDTELSRAARHELPIALIYIDVLGAQSANAPNIRRIAAAAAEALLGVVRAEDRVARIGELRFAVLATEAGDGRSLANRLGEHVGRHISRIGDDATGLLVTAGAADCQYDEMTRAELVREAERQVAASSALQQH
jgi:GGDEF domain-containing protein